MKKKQPVHWSIQDAVTKYHRLGDLQTEIYISQFWRLEAQRFGVWREHTTRLQTTDFSMHPRLEEGAK